MSLLDSFRRRFQLLRHRPCHWRLRPGTIDRRLFRDVVIRNEYRLPGRFDANDVIVDIGAHAGSFALAALRRGAGRVLSCEADADNFQLLQHNLRGFGSRSILLQRVIWRSDRLDADLPFANLADQRNTGAGAVAEDDGACVRRVAALSFDALIDQAGAHGRQRIRLVKLDCEGAEWPILLTSRALDRIDALCGEYHLGPFPACYHVSGITTFSTGLLASHLRAQGFHVELQPTTLAPRQTSLTELGLFFAERRRRKIVRTECRAMFLERRLSHPL